MNKYIEELVTEMQFDFHDLAFGLTYKEIGYDTRKEFFEEMKRKIDELASRLSVNEEIVYE
jgi:hypothetical protein